MIIRTEFGIFNNKKCNNHVKDVLKGLYKNTEKNIQFLYGYLRQKHKSMAEKRGRLPRRLLTSTDIN